ncbi:RanBD1 domain-containing protein [Citrus sinensis]|nr:RanBD1 domain-containing protein [Citrus sinensis]
MEGSLFDVHRAEPSQQQSMTTEPLDMQRAESSRQHVSALNTQFASWVQTQLKNHPDELWEDGVQDYLAHASKIMEKFRDVVDWLKANTLKAGNSSAAEPFAKEKKLETEIKINDVKSSQEKTFTPVTTTTSFATSGSFGLLSSSSATGSSGIFFSSAASGTSGIFSNNSASGGSGLFSSNSASGSSGLFSSNAVSGSSGLFSNNAASGSSGLFSNKSTSGSSLFSSNGTSGSSLFSDNATSGSSLISNSAASWSSGAVSNSQTPVFFGNQSSLLQNSNDLNDADGEDEVPQPSSPSLKKSEEKGIIVVHEVKCKLYVKSSDPADKDTWKDRGTGQLSIKCKEGISKGTKESKPTILVRNDSDRFKNMETEIKGDDAGGGNNGSAAARTFLIRTKTEEDRNKLATAIQEYAPAS